MGIFGSNGVRAGAAYQISRSLRFNDDDSADLTRTNGSAGNRRIWTWSGWVKRGNISKLATIFHGGVNSGLGATFLYFETTDKLSLYFAGTDYRTTALFRDPSAWYHIVVLWDTAQATASDRLKIWVNNSLQSLSGAPAQNSDSFWNNSGAMYIGSLLGSSFPSYYFDGYMAEVHFIDGTALDPTSFGEFDTNGVWRPIQVTGLTYGTNGFYLSFADNTSTTTLGYDDAGSNDWTLNNFSVTAGAGNDSLEDTPTNNWATLNPIRPRDAAFTMSNGNLSMASGAADGMLSSTAGMASDKWYAEITFTAGTGYVGIENGAANLATIPTFIFGGKHYVYLNTGDKVIADVSSAYGASFTTGDVIGVALDLTAPSVTFYKNNVSQGAITITDLGETWFFTFGTGTGSMTGDINFGQRPFTYTPPTGFSALCTANLPTPDIANPGAYMNAVLYTGTGSSLGVTGAGFQPDLVWIKSRSAATDHALYDSTRGVQKQIESNTTTDETTETTGLTAFGADGFTVGALAQVNTSLATYVAWCWKEGVTPGFDIVTYTGNGSNRTINHNLGAVPKLIIIKALTTAGTDQGWPVYQAANTAAPETDYLLLNSSAATADDITLWNDTAPTTTVFSVGTNALVNTSSDTYVAYLWAEVEGFSKFGSYTGNGSTDGPFCWTGFRPSWLLIKRSDALGEDWNLRDVTRNPYNVIDDVIYINTSNVEQTNNSIFNLDILSNGFKPRQTHASQNASGATYIFAAFASQPFSAPSNAR